MPKQPINTTAGSSTNITLSGIYTGQSNSSNAHITAISGTTSYVNYNYVPSASDGFYEKDGNLWWKNSKGESFQITFTKNEIISKLIDEL